MIKSAQEVIMGLAADMCDIYMWAYCISEKAK